MCLRNRRINETLKKYLEAVMTGVTPDVSARLIASEDKRLDEFRRLDRLRMNTWFKHVSGQYEISLEQFMEVLLKADSYRSFADQLGKVVDSDSAQLDTLGILERHQSARADLNEARSIFGLPAIKGDDSPEEPSESASRKGRRKKQSVPDVDSI